MAHLSEDFSLMKAFADGLDVHVQQLLSYFQYLVML